MRQRWVGIWVMVCVLQAHAQMESDHKGEEPHWDFSHLSDPTQPFWQEEVVVNVPEEKPPEPDIHWALQSIFKSSKGYLAIINGRSYRQGDALVPDVHLIRFEKNAVWLDKRGEEVRLPLISLEMNSP